MLFFLFWLSVFSGKQNVFLFPQRGLQYQEAPYLPNGIKISQLAKMLVDEHLWDDFAEYSVYKTHQHKKINELSGGERRQLEMLMIVHSKADFILLDEPFTHISPIQADDFKLTIRKCAKTKGIILTDHQYQNILEVSDKIILLHNGSTKHISSNEELITYSYLSNLPE